MIIMALDHVRMYFALGTWYSEPTNLATTTPLLFFTRWITHFCAPVFVFLAGTSAYLYGMRRANIRETALFLLTRGLWLIFVELVIVNFAWTFDITYSFRILQVIWAIGISLVVLSALVFLPKGLILGIGLLLVLGHNLLDSITVEGSSAPGHHLVCSPSTSLCTYQFNSSHELRLSGSAVDRIDGIGICIRVALPERCPCTSKENVGF